MTEIGDLSYLVLRNRGPYAPPPWLIGSRRAHGNRVNAPRIAFLFLTKWEKFTGIFTRLKRFRFMVLKYVLRHRSANIRHLRIVGSLIIIGQALWQTAVSHVDTGWQTHPETHGHTQSRYTQFHGMDKLPYTHSPSKIPSLIPHNQQTCYFLLFWARWYVSTLF